VDSITEERRGRRRRKALKGARIVFNNGFAVISCTVRNLSETGAALRVEGTLSLPDEFTLAFDDGSANRKCVVSWRRPTTIGVAFR
jgi:PilZ domain